MDYNYYFGIPHAHTSYSDGSGTPEEACEYARNNGLNFLFTADHSNFLDGVVKNAYEYNRSIDQYVEKSGSEWQKTRLQLQFINSRYQNFLALRGFEMSCSIGHINVINSKNYVEGKRKMKSLESFFSWLAAQEDVVAAVNHPGNNFRMLKYNPHLEGILTLIEVGNGSRKDEYIRTERQYFDGLDAGWHWGAINGQDNHRADWGDSSNLTVVLSSGIDEMDFIDALKNRRVYSTETGTLKLRVKANDYPMGSILNTAPGEKVQFDILASDPSSPIDTIEIITNGGTTMDSKAFNSAREALWSTVIKGDVRERWYVVKVIHSDGRWGISSPIFLRPYAA